MRSQNDVLELTMEDAKNTNEKLSIHLARHEANGTARQLALAYADQVSVYKPKYVETTYSNLSIKRPVLLNDLVGIFSKSLY